MTISVDDAKMVLRLLVEGSSIRSASRITGIDKATILKLLVLFGTACQRFLDARMVDLKLTHLQFDEQWTYVAKKQSRLTMTEREESHDKGDVYLWTCVDQKTKLMPSFLLGNLLEKTLRKLNCILRVSCRIEKSKALNIPPGWLRLSDELATLFA